MEFHEYHYVAPVQPAAAVAIAAQPAVIIKQAALAVKPAAPAIVAAQHAAVAVAAAQPVANVSLAEFLDPPGAMRAISVEEFNFVNTADAVTLGNWIARYGAPKIAAPFRFTNFHFNNLYDLVEIDTTEVRHRLDQHQFNIAADNSGLLVHLLSRQDLERYFAVQEHLIDARKTPYSFWTIAVMGDERPRNIMVIFDHSPKKVYMFDAAESWGNDDEDEDRVNFEQLDRFFVQYFADSGYEYVVSGIWRDYLNVQIAYTKQSFDNGCYNPLLLMLASALMWRPYATPAAALNEVIQVIQYNGMYRFTARFCRSLQD